MRAGALIIPSYDFPDAMFKTFGSKRRERRRERKKREKKGEKEEREERE